MGIGTGRRARDTDIRVYSLACGTTEVPRNLQLEDVKYKELPFLTQDKEKHKGSGSDYPLLNAFRVGYKLFIRIPFKCSFSEFIIIL